MGIVQDMLYSRQRHVRLEGCMGNGSTRANFVHFKRRLEAEETGVVPSFVNLAKQSPGAT